jgi:hypothetical protein
MFAKEEVEEAEEGAVRLHGVRTGTCGQEEAL